MTTKQPHLSTASKLSIWIRLTIKKKSNLFLAFYVSKSKPYILNKLQPICQKLQNNQTQYIKSNQKTILTEQWKQGQTKYIYTQKIYARVWKEKES